jgi:hypothetical protein
MIGVCILTWLFHGKRQPALCAGRIGAGWTLCIEFDGGVNVVEVIFIDSPYGGESKHSSMRSSTSFVDTSHEYLAISSRIVSRRSSHVSHGQF